MRWEPYLSYYILVSRYIWLLCITTNFMHLHKLKFIYQVIYLYSLHKVSSSKIRIQIWNPFFSLFWSLRLEREKKRKKPVLYIPRYLQMMAVKDTTNVFTCMCWGGKRKCHLNSAEDLVQLYHTRFAAYRICLGRMIVGVWFFIGCFAYIHALPPCVRWLWSSVLLYDGQG